MNNIVESYKLFKVVSLNKLGNFIYNPKDDISKEILRRFIENYFNSKFYNIYETEEDHTKEFDLSLLKREYNGLELELVDSYPNHNKEVKEIRKIAFFLCSIDRIYEDIEELTNLLNESLEENAFIKTSLGNKKDKFIKMYINMCNKENKIFAFPIDEHYLLNENDQKRIKLIDLSYNIKQVQGKYRKTLVNQAFKDDKIYTKKVINIINKLSYKILREKCYEIENPVKYIVLVQDTAIQDGDFAKEIKDIINNDLIVKHLGIALSDDIISTRQGVRNNKIKLSCFRDITYVNDLDKKFQSILALPIEYFIITSYKTKKENEVISYADSDPRIIIVEEEE